MDLHLKDKVVLITGGAKGIGEAITRGCAGEGAIPVFVDKDREAGKRLQTELVTAGATCIFIGADVLPAENCREAVEQTLKEHGRLDVLVNNVGANDNVGLENGSPEKFMSSLRLNLFHYYNMAHFALPALKKSQGCILNIASKVALTGQGGTSGYASAKGAVLSLTRDWAAELLPSGIRVNALVPAEVSTPLYKQWVSTFPNPEEKLAHIVSKIPLGRRMTQPAEIAAMVLFLISPQASHITGQHVFVDGGYTHLDRALT
ncbi:MAG TPA: SDR family oxidoreductase [Verrucomicrobiae bacterium]|jgi:L-fucose dehydrogenase|nr:SDR family oxidoreductase [Verrucomicrobiae bacterium]